jgi:hypothetical protein
MLGALVCGLTASIGLAADNDRANVTEKGSLLVYPLVEVHYSATGEVERDTFITLTNDYNLSPNVQVKMFFVSGDIRTTGCRWECPFADATLNLTPDQPAYWSVDEGRSFSNSGLGFSVIGNPIPNPNGSGGTIHRGYILAYAIDNNGHQIRWNHLFGEATIVDYLAGTAHTYQAYAFSAVAGSHGATIGSAGDLDLDGSQYDWAYEKVIFNFFVDGSEAFSATAVHSHEFDGATPDSLVTVTSDLTLLVLKEDFVGSNGRRVPFGTLARAVIWNENENKKTNTTRCIYCWDQTSLSGYATGPNWFTMALGTDMGKAEIFGEQSVVCEVDVCEGDDKMLGEDPNDIVVQYMNGDYGTIDEFALLGVIVKNLDFDGMASATASHTLNGKGNLEGYFDTGDHGSNGGSDEAPTDGPIQIAPDAPVFELEPAVESFSQLQRRQ